MGWRLTSLIFPHVSSTIEQHRGEVGEVKIERFVVYLVETLSPDVYLSDQDLLHRWDKFCREERD